MDTTNAIGFLISVPQFVTNILRLTDLQKVVVVSELISNDKYAKVVGFTSGSVILSFGSKKTDKLVDTINRFSAGEFSPEDISPEEFPFVADLLKTR